MNCALCTERLMFRWTDTHGVAVCCHCGLPYTVYHYEGEGESRKRVEKAPEPALSAYGMTLVTAYWNERKRMVCPGEYDMPGSDYSGWTVEDQQAFGDWFKENGHRFEAASDEAAQGTTP